MRLAKCDLKVLGNAGYKSSENLMIIEQFAESGSDIMEVLDFPQKTAGHCAASLNSSIKRYKKGGFVATSRKGHVYLVKEDCIKKNK